MTKYLLGARNITGNKIGVLFLPSIGVADRMCYEKIPRACTARRTKLPLTVEQVWRKGWVRMFRAQVGMVEIIYSTSN